MAIDKKRLVIGFHAVEDLLNSTTTVGKVFINKAADRQKIGVLRQLAKKREIPFQMVPLEKLNRLTKANHQGVVAIKSPIDFVPLEETITRLYEEGKLPKVVVADGIQDVRNLGAIARSCLAFDVDLLVMGTKANAEIGEGAMKSSAGALLKLPVCRVSSLDNTLNYLKSWGVIQLGASEKAEQFDLNKLDIQQQGWALWMGNEDRGLSRERQEKLDGMIKIGMNPAVDSLNVSVATGILLHQFYHLK